MATQERSFTPPYGIPWRTLYNLLERLGAEGLPNRIDRTFIRNLSGQAQSYLMSALRGFELVGENGEVTDTLREMVGDAEARRAGAEALLRRFYPKVVELGTTTATPGELADAFSEMGVQGDARRKAITFYLNGAQYAGIPVSPLWTTPKGRSAAAAASGGSTRRPRKSKGRKTDPDPDAQTTTHTGAGYSHRIDLESGSVTLTYSMDLFRANAQERDFVLGLVDSMKEFEQKHRRKPRAQKPKAAAETPTQETEQQNDGDEK